MPDDAMPPSPNEAEPLSPGQLLGHPGLLRAWRAVAGERLGLGRPLSQTEVAEAIGRSRGWYQNLERGARPKMDREVLDALARTLFLGRDEYQALILLLLNGSVPDPAGPPPVELSNPAVRRDLQLLLDQQEPNPAYVTDGVWNILGYNSSMHALWPWVGEPGANLIRWSMLSQEARYQFVDWEQHAVEYVKLLRFASTLYPHDPDLMKLIADTRADPRCGPLWDIDLAAVSESRDGHRFKMVLPTLGHQTIEVVSTVLFPLGLPGSRATIITWAGPDDAPSARTAAAHERSATPWSSFHSTTAEHSTYHRLVATPEAATELAGPRAVDLPLLSALLGAEDHLALDPSTGSVIHSTRSTDGRWDFTEVSAADLLRKLPGRASAGDVRPEYKRLLRAALPADPADAARSCSTHLQEARDHTEALTQVRNELLGNTGASPTTQNGTGQE